MIDKSYSNKYAFYAPTAATYTYDKTVFDEIKENTLHKSSALSFNQSFDAL